MRTFDWLVFAFLLALVVGVPYPTAHRQMVTTIMQVVLLVLIACLLLLSLR